MKKPLPIKPRRINPLPCKPLPENELTKMPYEERKKFYYGDDDNYRNKQLKGYSSHDWANDIVKDWVAVFVKDIDGIKISHNGRWRVMIQEEVTYWMKPYKTKPIEVKSEVRDKTVLYLDDLNVDANSGLLIALVPEIYKALMNKMDEKMRNNVMNEIVDTIEKDFKFKV